MKMRVTTCEKPWNSGKYKVQKYSWMWGWEDYDGLIFNSYEGALNHTMIVKTLNG